jgi:hypothetical protein
MAAIAISWDSFLANGQTIVAIPVIAVKTAMMLTAPVKLSAYITSIRNYQDLPILSDISPNDTRNADAALAIAST